MEFMNQKGISSIVIILIIVGVLVAGSGAWYYFVKTTPIGSRQCPEDAKTCSDGSTVSRILPQCEFATCPEVKDETADWQTYRNEEYGFEIRYPSNLSPTIRERQSGIGFLMGGISIVKDEINTGNLKTWYDAYYAKNMAVEGIQPNMSGPDMFKETTFNGYAAIKATGQFAFDHRVTIIYFSRDKMIFCISYPDSDGNDPDFENHYRMYKEIFATFKFIP